MKSIPRYFRCKPKSRKRLDVQTAKAAEKFLNYVYHKCRDKILQHVMLFGNTPPTPEQIERWMEEKKKGTT